MSGTRQAPDFAKSLKDLEARFAPMAEGQPVLQMILALILRLFRCLLANVAAPAPERPRRKAKTTTRRFASRAPRRARRIVRVAVRMRPRAVYFPCTAPRPMQSPLIATKGGLRFSSA